MKPAAERIFLYKDNELVTFASLSEEEKKYINILEGNDVICYYSRR